MSHNITHFTNNCTDNKYEILDGRDINYTRLENKLLYIVSQNKSFTCYVQDLTCRGVMRLDRYSNILGLCIGMTMITIIFLSFSFSLYFIAKRVNQVNIGNQQLDDIDVYDNDDEDDDNYVSDDKNCIQN